MRIIIAEIKYYQAVFTAMTLPLIIFTLCAITDVKVITTMQFVDKYFWSITIGLGSYLLLYGLQANRLKEERDRLHHSLPVKLRYLAASRYTFGILPVILIAIYLKLLVYILPADWEVFCKSGLCSTRFTFYIPGWSFNTL